VDDDSITIALIVGRRCVRAWGVTGKGLSDLIREEYGLRITFVMMIGSDLRISATSLPSLPV